MIVHRFINTPVSSNTYIIYNEITLECIVIDPGTKGAEDIISYISQYNLSPSYIILTHDHFDHVWGVNYLVNKYGPKIICSHNCAKRLSIPQNYFNLLYYGDNTPLSIEHVDIVLTEDTQLEMVGEVIDLIQTPGHSDSSICVYIKGCLFSGDTLMKGFQPVLKKRHGACLDELLRSVNSIYIAYPKSIVYPGHGDPFLISEGINWFKELYPSYNFADHDDYYSRQS